MDFQRRCSAFDVGPRAFSFRECVAKFRVTIAGRESYEPVCYVGVTMRSRKQG